MAFTATGAENNANREVRWGSGGGGERGLVLPFTHSLARLLFFKLTQSSNPALALGLALGLALEDILRAEFEICYITRSMREKEQGLKKGQGCKERPSIETEEKRKKKRFKEVKGELAPKPGRGPFCERVEER